MLQKAHIILIVLFFPISMFAQQTNYRLGKQFEQDINKQISISNNIIHTGFKPLLKSNVESKIISDSTVYKKYPWFINGLYKKMFKEDLITVKKENLNINFNILINYQKGNSKNDTKEYSQNTRGFEVYGDIGDKLSYYTSFHENQAFFILLRNLLLHTKNSNIQACLPNFRNLKIDIIGIITKNTELLIILVFRHTIQSSSEFLKE